MATLFKTKVYLLAGRIPKGKVATYGQIAKLAGNARAARAVGALMRGNPDAPRIPCHRVVAANGSMRGYSAEGGIKRKKEILAAEGVRFKGDRVDLSLSGWRGGR